jgi:beta-galactosidase
LRGVKKWASLVLRGNLDFDASELFLMNSALFLKGTFWRAMAIAFGFGLVLAASGGDAVDLPAGVKAVWDFEKAYREVTPTMERICLNGLWRWQPAVEGKMEAVPEGSWGWFKTPGAWPGITDYMQKDSQTLFRHPDWKDVKLETATAAWQEREITVLGNWAGRQIVLQAEYLNSFATVFVDGKKAGEMRFPGGEVDLAALCEPGKHRLTMLVVALPLKGVLLSYTDSASARTVKGSVARRGICGDVFLTARPAGARIADVKVRTSVRKGEVTFDVGLQEPGADKAWKLEAHVQENDGQKIEFASRSFKGDEVRNGRFRFTQSWKPKRLWDIHTPTNQCEVIVTLRHADGRVADQTFQTKFAFREFWIEGKDFYLNGSRIFLSAVPLDNAEIGAAWATHDAARESLARLKSFGINFVYTHNYGCEPGSHLSFAEVLQAADDVGMLVALSQPHFSHYEWKSADADKTNGYAAHARFYAEVAGNHPSVVFYSMSHNATGYSEDMNPFMIDGINDPRDQWAERNAKLAMRAEAIVGGLDPGRIVYHHASGNLGSMHDMNFYPNFAPIQELSDWFGHWATNGVKPAFMCEYGAPFTWDWTMYRGWYQGEREFGSAKVPWEFCIAEWNAQFLGDAAYRISEAERTNLRWEAKQFRAGNTWHRWDYPAPVGSTRFEEGYPIFAEYLTDNWRAFRGWGVSGISPWEHEHFWKLREGVKRTREDFKVDWENLQRPGFSPDYIDQRYERMDLAFEKSDWLATPAAQVLLRNNRPLLAFIAGKADAFTSKDHNFSPGELVEKQILVINNSREPISAKCSWSINLPTVLSGTHEIKVETGRQGYLGLIIELPKTLSAGEYELKATIKFSSGEEQSDALKIHVLPKRAEPEFRGKIAVFDPNGETVEWLRRKSIPYDRVDAAADLSGFDLLIVGKRALTRTNAAPDISGVAKGLKVLIFEQAGQVLEKRFGFRVEEYGLREIFPRVPDHPALKGVRAEHLRNWRGAATLLSPQLDYEMRPRYGPTIQWCDIPVTRVWRCGNRGNVASALIEKPACGDFLAIVDGGYSLQYTPLLEYREGSGVVMFCQLDVTARSESDPAAEMIADNLLQYLSDWKPTPRRSVAYAGDAAGGEFLKSIGVNPQAPEQGGEVLVIGPGGASAINTNHVRRALAIGLGAADLKALNITSRESEHISSYFETMGFGSPFAGVSCADVHNRDPRMMALITGGAEPAGDGVLARGTNAPIVFCQLAPWQFEGEQMNLRRTRRHVSVLVARLLANLGAEFKTPILTRFNAPVDETKKEQRWRDGLYVDQPQEWDDPYRFFRW